MARGLLACLVTLAGASSVRAERHVLASGELAGDSPASSSANGGVECSEKDMYSSMLRNQADSGYWDDCLDQALARAAARRERDARGAARPYTEALFPHMVDGHAGTKRWTLGLQLEQDTCVVAKDPKPHMPRNPQPGDLIVALSFYATCAPNAAHREGQTPGSQRFCQRHFDACPAPKCTTVAKQWVTLELDNIHGPRTLVFHLQELLKHAARSWKMTGTTDEVEVHYRRGSDQVPVQRALAATYRRQLASAAEGHAQGALDAARIGPTARADKTQARVDSLLKTRMVHCTVGQQVYLVLKPYVSQGEWRWGHTSLEGGVKYLATVREAATGGVDPVLKVLVHGKKAKVSLSELSTLADAAAVAAAPSGFVRNLHRAD